MILKSERRIGRLYGCATKIIGIRSKNCIPKPETGRESIFEDAIEDIGCVQAVMKLRRISYLLGARYRMLIF